jgi:hypothetical protein
MELTFDSVLVSWPHGFMKTAIVVPDEIVRRLPGGRVRVEGTVNGAPFALAVQRAKDGTRYLAASAALRKTAGIDVHDHVRIVCRVVDPDALAVPDELQALLDVDDEARTVWNSFTRGTQRGLVHYVTSVKSSDARIRRAVDFMRKAVNGELHAMKRARSTAASVDTPTVTSPGTMNE